MDVIKEDAIASSHTYSLIEPFGHTAIDAMGAIIPFFKNIFSQLSDFFELVAQSKV